MRIRYLLYIFLVLLTVVACSTTDGIPDDAVVGIVMDKLYGLAHVVVTNGIVAPTALHHEHVAEAASMNDDLIMSQILVGIDNPGVFLSA